VFAEIHEMLRSIQPHWIHDRPITIDMEFDLEKWKSDNHTQHSNTTFYDISMTFLFSSVWGAQNSAWVWFQQNQFKEIKVW
jgi:hypothetical protein